MDVLVRSTMLSASCQSLHNTNFDSCRLLNRLNSFNCSCAPASPVFTDIISHSSSVRSLSISASSCKAICFAACSVMNDAEVQSTSIISTAAFSISALNSPT